MRALVYTDWDRLEVRDLPEPTCGPGEAIIRVAACGVCGSELGSFAHRSPRRPPPLVMGHEFSGTVAAVGKETDAGGSGPPLAEGQRVVVNSLVHCGACDLCRRDLSHLCRNRQVFGMHRPGAFAEYVAVPTKVVLPLPDSVSFIQGAMVEPLGNALHVLSLARDPAPGQVIIFGAGPIGLMCLQAARAAGARRVVVTDTHAARRQTALSLGAEKAIDPRAVTVSEWALAATEGGFDLAIDAVGAGETKRDAVRAVHPGGEAVWIGLHEDESPQSSYDLILSERRLTGSYGATETDLRRAIALLASGAIQTEGWLDLYPLEQGEAGFRAALRQELKGAKAVLCP